MRRLDRWETRTAVVMGGMGVVLGVVHLFSAVSTGLPIIGLGLVIILLALTYHPPAPPLLDDRCGLDWSKPCERSK